MTTEEPRGPGRPPSDNPRNKVVPVRYTDEGHAEIKQAAGAEGLTLSAWIEKVTLAAAKRAKRRRST